MSLESYTTTKSNIHFSLYGEGPPIALFHPSPNSSIMMHDLAIELAPKFTVICPDTPGYGTSPKLIGEDPDMKDFAAAFNSLFAELGFDSVALYGSATGSQIAIRYGLEYPDHVSHLFLDNCAHFTAEERQAVLENYFPDLTPRADGEHLVILWDMVSSLFHYFPWCFKDEEHKLSGPIPPPAVLHTIVKDYLKAGADYDLAYKAAFDHEKVDHIQSLKVPTTVLRWQGSIIKKYADRIFDHDLPANVSGKVISADRSLRYKEIAEHIAESYISDQQYAKDTLVKDLIINEKENINTDDQDESPTPDAQGLYLIRAWHELKDKDMLSSIKNNSPVEPDPKVLQRQLINWFSNINSK